MKNIITAFFAVTMLAVSPAIAQQDGANSDQVAERVETIAARLKLTEAQKPQVEAILRDSMEQRQAILEKYGVEKGKRPSLRLREKRELRSELQAVSQEMSAKLSGVLSAEQMAEFEAIQEEQRAQMRERLQSR